jgi:hypothetical protein
MHTKSTKMQSCRLQYFFFEDSGSLQQEIFTSESSRLCRVTSKPTSLLAVTQFNLLSIVSKTGNCDNRRRDYVQNDDIRERLEVAVVEKKFVQYCLR